MVEQLTSLTAVSLWGVRNRAKKLRALIANRKKDGHKSPVACSMVSRLERAGSYLMRRLGRLVTPRG